MDQIDSLRHKINQLDDQIMELLDQRFSIAKEIGEQKQINKAVLDTSREDYIYDKTTKYSHSPRIKSIYTTIMNESKGLQRK